ncbi:MAG: hypothetical protein ACRD12_22040 [Acidimicrobiales bacterium]
MTQTTLSRTMVCQCRFAAASRAHHDRLLQAEADLSAVVELLELAVTWDELDYSQEPVIPPGDWLEFAACHAWRDEAVQKLFSAAVDVALRHRCHR